MMNLLHTKLYQYKIAIFMGLLTSVMANEAAQASLQSLTETGSSVKTLVTGPLGTAVLLIATIGGSVGAIMKGNIWMSISILIVGIITGIQVDSMSQLFEAR